LIKAIIEEFAPRFSPGAQLLYAGDTGEKWGYFDEEALYALGELAALFQHSTAGLVFVTAFPNRSTMGRYLGEIAWETEIWVADAPSRMIHFNGERFLDPY
jgi:BsuBI/PstI restriction endonuclease domain